MGCLAVEVQDGRSRQFIKWVPQGVNLDLIGVARRMRWARPYFPVPQVVDAGRGDTGSWLVTEALPGEMAVMPRWKADPSTAVRAIGEGLRAFHEALAVEKCPFSLSAEDRVADAQRRAAE